MARGGLSSDKEKRAKQLAVLEHGRMVAADRRARGLPPKRKQAIAGASRGKDPADGVADAPAKTIAGKGPRVVEGTYDEGRGTSGRRRQEDPREPPDPAEHDDAPALGGIAKLYGRISGLIP